MADVRADWDRHYPVRNSRDRAWTFVAPADGVLARIKGRLTRARGWYDVAETTDHVTDAKGRRRLVQTNLVFQNEDTDALAIFVDYKGNRGAVVCALLVREPRNPWGKVKGLARDLKPR